MSINFGCGGYFRFFILFLSFMGHISQILVMKNLVYALQGMVKQEQEENKVVDCSTTCWCYENNTETGETTQGEFNWDIDIQTTLLSVPGFGQILGTFTGLFVYNYLFLRPVLSVALIWTGLLNLLTPEIIHVGGYQGLMVARFVIGIYVGMLSPAANIFCDFWFQEHEKNFSITVSYAGLSAGNVFFAATGALNTALGWQALFRIPGSFAVLTGILTFIFYTDDPIDNSYVSLKEARLLKAAFPEVPRSSSKGSSLSGVSKAKKRTFLEFHLVRHEKKKPAPLLKAITYAPVWSIFMGQFAVMWMLEATLNYTQIYLMEMHNFTLGRTSLLNSVPTNISLTVFGIVSCMISDWAIHKGMVAKLTVRRIGGLIIIVSTMYFVLLGYLDCVEVNDNILWLMILSSLRAGMFISVSPSTIDISPTHQTSLNTCMEVIGYLPAVIVPQIMTMVGIETREQWKSIFLFSVAVIIATIGFYLLALTDQVQEFDDAVKLHRRKKRSTVGPRLTAATVRSFAKAFKADTKHAKRIQKSWIGFEDHDNIAWSIWDIDEEENILSEI